MPYEPTAPIAAPRRALAALALAGAALAAAPPAAAQTTVFLVRHAEKVADGSADPGLTPLGACRAEALAALLADAGLTAVYTSEYRRTRDTAAPAAAAAGVEPVVVPADDVEGLAVRLVAGGPGAALVVGHSNTVPGILAALGLPGPPIGEDEHDNLFVAALPADGPPGVARLRYPAATDAGGACGGAGG